MRVQLTEIGPDGRDVEQTLTPIWLEGLFVADGQTLPWAAAGESLARVRLRRIGLDVLVEGAFQVAVRAECSACLKEFELGLPVAFSLALQPGAARPAGLPVQQELTSSDCETAFYEGDEIDVEAILREQILLALPMVPRCAEDCRGLCPRCGVDRNHEPCRCASTDEDVRWAGLATLKASTSRGEESP